MSVGFAKDIRPLFTQTDIDHMEYYCDLSNHEDVKANAAEILSRLEGEDGPVMPPENAGGPWSPEKIALFKSWIAGGCQL
jgi:hypothetical protein